MTPRDTNLRLALGDITRLLFAMAVVLGLLVSGPVTEEAEATSASCSNAVSIVPPASDLASRVANSSAGICFTLAPGSYNFSDVVPKDGMSFVGAGADVVIVNGWGRENAFHGTADGVTIAHMTFQNFDSSGGTTRAEQAPIRGTRALWNSFRGTMATNWTVDSVVSRDNYASGIFLGDHFTVVNSVFSGNGVTGIGGNEIVGGLIQNNVVFGNGAKQAGGAGVNGGGIKVTQTGTLDEPLVVRGNEFYANHDIAVWCDISCRGFHAIDNYIHDHRSSGIVIELSSGAVIRGNRIENSNTWSDFGIDFNAGAITIAESSNSIVEDNYITGGRAGVMVRQTLRPLRPAESFLDRYKFVNYVTSDVLVQRNILVDIDLMGFTTGRTGAGIVPNPASIRFVGNRYANPGGVEFHHNGTNYNHSSWVASGRDAGVNSGGLPAASTYGPSRNSLGGPAPIPASPPTSPAVLPPNPSPIAVSTPPSRGLLAEDFPLRINAGGGAIVDSIGRAWLADRYFIRGSAAEHAQGRDIAATSFDSLYRNERWGATGYQVPVPNGTYRLVTHHGEVYDGCQRTSCRVFDVLVEGESMANDLDIFAEVGGYSAMQLERTVTVADNLLDLSFVASRQSAQVSGIEIFALGATAPVTQDAPPSRSTTGGTQGPREGGVAPVAMDTPSKRGASPSTPTQNPNSPPVGNGPFDAPGESPSVDPADEAVEIVTVAPTDGDRSEILEVDEQSEAESRQSDSDGAQLSSAPAAEEVAGGVPLAGANAGGLELATSMVEEGANPVHLVWFGVATALMCGWLVRRSLSGLAGAESRKP